jgi:two-component system OmpR family sensor kinase
MGRLHRRIYLHALLVLVVVGVATAAVFALSTRGAFVREMAEGMTRHVASVVAEAMHDPAALRQRVERIGAELDLDLAVRDLEGRLLASSGAPLSWPTAGELRRVQAGRMAFHRGPGRYVLAPVRDPRTGAVLGLLQGAGRHRASAGTLLRPALIAGVILLVVALATRPLARRIARPLERLTEAARRLGQGDLSSRVAPSDGDGHRRRGHRRDDEIVQLTQAFNDMADHVERLVHGQRELLANVSHELRSPLARIRVALALLPREGGTEARLADVERDLDDLERLIEDVLTTARLEATGLPAHLGSVDLGRLLAELAERAGRDPLLAGRAVAVDAGPPVAVMADEALLRRALWNLVENAAKYGAPPITLGAGRRNDRVLLSVTDQGPGIPAADRERVLAPFYRGDAARTPSAGGEPRRGVGLGLTLARRVAEVHGGTITIEPAGVVEGQERGCRVTLALPATDGRDPPGT